ncbi:hypothetical protein REDROCK_65 [Mycobacterium phage RedRock]|uniref:Uncharacterized protein n=1 Tax=Mycobacterium phage RedRock TaxID=711470 RepID=D3JZC7_9CAUD|nr:hypothetical protein REDROCK_65 [Mycobacterium phage RedRock]ADB93758.1 hypothetical protein REDROCK_65 [Mycobacterium phage RedRock]
MSTGEFVIVLELAVLIGGMFGGMLRGPRGPQGFQGPKGEKGEPPSWLA